MSTIRAINAKLKCGDALTNPELKAGIEHYDVLERHLSEMGPEFELSWIEVNRRLRMMKEWSQSRGLDYHIKEPVETPAPGR